MSDAAEGLTPIPVNTGGRHDNKQYYSYVCSGCGKQATNCYISPTDAEMLEWRVCFHCHYWKDFERKSKPELMTIIEGRTYSPGNAKGGKFQGMAGRRFDIEYLSTSVYAGQRCTTFDLWAGSEIPEHLRAKYPNTAKFLTGAECCDASGTTCWNGSSLLSPEFPPPSQLKRVKP